jgi:hypothetical protein
MAPDPKINDPALRHMMEQSEKVLTGDGQSPDYDDSDPATYWGKRLGRIVGFAVLAYLIWHLYSTYLMA